MPEGFVDPYIDPETGVLRNLVGATSYKELANAEGELVPNRVSEFFEGPRRCMTGSSEDFRLIHRALFQDVFDWAGEFRTIEIRKNAEGAEFFLPSINILTGIAWSQEELARDGMLRGLGVGEFCERLAYHYDNYNFVHPFREGNGRTQRLFWSIVCRDAGYDLDWRCVTGAENDEASRMAAEERDLRGLVGMFRRIALPCGSEVLSGASLSGGGHLG